MSNHLRAGLEAILQKCKTKPLWNNEDRLELKRLRMELGKVSEVAKSIVVSKATLRWWEREEPQKDQLRPPPPADKLAKLRDLIIEKYFHSLLKSPANTESGTTNSFYDVFVRLRNLSEIMERAQYAQNFWAFRFGRPFRAGMDEQVFNDTVDFVLKHKTNIFFVYRDIDTDETETAIYLAKKSFRGIEQKIEAHNRRAEIKKWITGIPVSGSRADKLGLVDPWSAYLMIEYTDDGYMKYGRAIDVWTENVFEGVEEKQMVWLELPPSDAVKWKQRRANILNEAVKKCRD